MIRCADAAAGVTLRGRVEVLPQLQQIQKILLARVREDFAHYGSIRTRAGSQLFDLHAERNWTTYDACGK
jgi:hypothetical protein